MENISDKFWYYDLGILFNRYRLFEFYPTSSHSKEEKLNAIARLSIYTGILLASYKKDLKYLFYSVAGLLITYQIYQVNKKDKNIDEKDIENQETIETLKNQNKECTLPTLDNPFMNPTMKDYMNFDKEHKIVDRPPACNTDDPNIKKQIDEHFNNNLYKNVDDIFGKMNSQRQFYTVPSTTIPNKQDEFAKWLYLSPKTCKEDQDYCLRYEDLRNKKPIFVNPEENPVNN